METKTCEICGQTLPLSVFSKSYKGRCKDCVAKLTREKRNGTTNITHRSINWEQRRYEIAKDMLCALYTDEGFDAREKNDAMFEYQDLDSCAKEAVRYYKRTKKIKYTQHGKRKFWY